LYYGLLLTYFTYIDTLEHVAWTYGVFLITWFFFPCSTRRMMLGKTPNLADPLSKTSSKAHAGMYYTTNLIVIH